MNSTHSQSVAVMGTVLTIEARSANRASIDRAIDWVRKVETVCSRFDAASEVSRLAHQSGRAVAVTPMLFEMLQFALAMAEFTGGAFDPTLGLVAERRGFNREYRSGQRITTPIDGIATWQDVDLDADARMVTLHKPMLIDLGALAKGFAIDLAVHSLEEDGCSDFVIDAGGDLYLAGRNDAGEPWSVGVRHPMEDGALIDRLLVSDAAVCTSGNYERVNAEGQRAAHLIDPANMRGATRSLSATVIAPNAAAADALATAAFVLGPVDGIALLERAEVDGMIIAPDLARHTTPGMAAYDGRVTSSDA